MKKVLAAGRLSLKVGVSRPLSTENSSEKSMMAFACKNAGGRGGKNNNVVFEGCVYSNMLVSSPLYVYVLSL